MLWLSRKTRKHVQNPDVYNKVQFCIAGALQLAVASVPQEPRLESFKSSTDKLNLPCILELMIPIYSSTREDAKLRLSSASPPRRIFLAGLFEKEKRQHVSTLFRSPQRICWTSKRTWPPSLNCFWYYPPSIVTKLGTEPYVERDLSLAKFFCFCLCTIESL